MPEVATLVDGYGDAVLVDLATVAGSTRAKSGVSVGIAVKSGNPYRDPRSGTFGAGPAGTKVSAGNELLAGLTNAAHLYVTQISNKFGADGVSAIQKGNRVFITLTKGGQQVSVLNLPAGAGAAQGGATATVNNRDEIVQRARSAASIDKLDQQSRAQRIDDLVDYMFARYNANGAIFEKPGSVRVAAPNGWDKKNIAHLTDNELAEVSRRLSARSWTKDAVNKLLLGSLDKARQTKIGSLV